MRATSGPTVALSIIDYAFSPMNLTIAAGTTVRATNNGSAVHTWTSSSNWDSGDLSAGKSFAFKFTTAGSFSFVCTRHQAIMTGTVTVN